EVASEAEAEHPSEPAHLASGDIVEGVCLEAGVVDHGDNGMVGQVTGDGHGVLVLALYPQMERLHAPQQQVGGHGMERGAVDLAIAVDPPDEVLPADDHPAQGVRMAA